MTQPDAFSYIVAIQLIIVGMGVTKILEGVSWLIEHRSTCKGYWVHTLSAVLIGLLLLQYAWTSFYDYSVTRWTFGDFLLECATPLIYLFAADLIFPNDLPKDSDLQRVYLERIKLIATLVIAAQVVNSALDYRYHPDEHLLRTQHWVRVAVVFCLLGLYTPFEKCKRLHEFVFVLLLGALIAYCIFLTPAIETKPSKAEGAARILNSA